jgi:hypothetical protein
MQNLEIPMTINDIAWMPWCDEDLQTVTDEDLLHLQITEEDWIHFRIDERDLPCTQVLQIKERIVNSHGHTRQKTQPD